MGITCNIFPVINDTSLYFCLGIYCNIFPVQIIWYIILLLLHRKLLQYISSSNYMIHNFELEIYCNIFLCNNR